jgi:hypothetical protein
MPEIELKPDDYRVQTKRGRWLNRDDFRFAFPYAGAICAFWIGFAWWNRADISPVMLISVVGGCCFAFGVLVGAWLKRFD